MNVVTVKEKTARRGKMHGGEMREGKMREGKMCEGKMRGEKIHGRKRKWNCVSIYGMIGIDVCGGICSKAA